MRIKHWQGYGTVTAKKLSKRLTGRGTMLRVMVQGNHEWGLVREDKYDLKRWLIDRFDKDAKNVSPYEISYRYDAGYVKVNGLDTETVIYTFEY